MKREVLLKQFYQALRDRLGAGQWWPAEDPFEIAVGAILTQNTNWNNVEKALNNLKKQDVLSPKGIRSLNISELEQLIRPSGFYRMKALRLINLLDFMDENNISDLSDLAAYDVTNLREKLLQVKGIGPETADSILLYALSMPVFVVDAYTKRIFNRHALIPEEIEYAELQDFFMDVLERDSQFYCEFHSLIVQTAKKWCTKNNPDCEHCPLGSFLDN
ncbi:endonuclease III domain-containing protein [Maridesulfovibrio bastinii]|uniref:endonuclease III domain-containing protein n=1 Tax=Maridesulfovibrio bastinii TaxID=47157 RepID=UPI0004267A0D|nr:endonuclease [Maridesulfovibrio bastinii]